VMKRLQEKLPGTGGRSAEGLEGGKCPLFRTCRQWPCPGSTGAHPQHFSRRLKAIAQASERCLSGCQPPCCCATAAGWPQRSKQGGSPVTHELCGRGVQCGGAPQEATRGGRQGQSRGAYRVLTDPQALALPLSLTRVEEDPQQSGWPFSLPCFCWACFACIGPQNAGLWRACSRNDLRVVPAAVGLMMRLHFPSVSAGSLGVQAEEDAENLREKLVGAGTFQALVKPPAVKALTPLLRQMRFCRETPA